MTSEDLRYSPGPSCCTRWEWPEIFLWSARHSCLSHTTATAYWWYTLDKIWKVLKEFMRPIYLILCPQCLFFLFVSKPISLLVWDALPQNSATLRVKPICGCHSNQRVILPANTISTISNSFPALFSNTAWLSSSQMAIIQISLNLFFVAF